MNRHMKYWILDIERHLVEVDVLTWGRWFENISARRVDHTDINKQVYVSTVFLGIDHGLGREGPPLVFESMVFGLPEGERDCWRYSSWDDAQIGHNILVKRLKLIHREGCDKLPHPPQRG